MKEADDATLDRAGDWAFSNQKDTLAKSYVGLCFAIGSIEDDAVTESGIFDPEGNDDSFDKQGFGAQSRLEDTWSGLIKMRDELAVLIVALLDNLDNQATR